MTYFEFDSAHVNSIFRFSGLNPTSADIILVPEACSENVYSASHLGFFLSLGHKASCLFTVSSVHCKQNSRPTVLQGCSRDARTKQRPTFLVGRRNAPTLKHYGCRQVSGYAHISQRRPGRTMEVMLLLMSLHTKQNILCT